MTTTRIAIRCVLTAALIAALALPGFAQRKKKTFEDTTDVVVVEVPVTVVYEGASLADLTVESFQLSPDGASLLLTVSDAMTPGELYIQLATAGAAATRMTNTVSDRPSVTHSKGNNCPCRQTNRNGSPSRAAANTP